MSYYYSYYRATDPINLLAANLPPPPVIHEFGPLAAGEMRYYDPQTDRWVSEKPVVVEQLCKNTSPYPSMSEREDRRHY
jgi:hypothetical protein